MWYQVLIPSPLLLIPVLVMTTKCHTPKDNPDVIVISSKHVDAIKEMPVKNDPEPLKEDEIIMETTAKTVAEVIVTRATTLKETEAETDIIPSNEDVVFIPNEKEVPKVSKEKTVEDYWREETGLQHEQQDKMGLQDLSSQGQKNMDVLNSGKIKIETEKPNEDIIFLSGKNIDEMQQPEVQERKPEKKKIGQVKYRKHPNAKKKPIKLNCTNLDCNNNLSSVCGGKLENRQWKYRLFLNECYFRKVNCYFKKRENRYQEVHLDHCENVGIHSTEPFEFKPSYQSRASETERPFEVGKLIETRRFSSRRSLTMGIDGRLCSHPCPTFCSEHYEPECAVSGTGQIRVFMNHCKMDWNSCSYGVVWQRRPLATCVGNEKADIRHNRGFINWLQTVGIVDNKGRLALH